MHEFAWFDIILLDFRMTRFCMDFDMIFLDFRMTRFCTDFDMILLDFHMTRSCTVLGPGELRGVGGGAVPSGHL